MAGAEVGRLATAPGSLVGDGVVEHLLDRGALQRRAVIGRKQDGDEAREVRRWRHIVAEALPEVPDPERAFAELWHNFGQAQAWRTFDAVVNFLSYDAPDAGRMVETFAETTRQYVHISSGSIYAKPVRQIPISESTPTAPNPFLPYATTKWRAEQALYAAQQRHAEKQHHEDEVAAIVQEFAEAQRLARPPIHHRDRRGEQARNRSRGADRDDRGAPENCEHGKGAAEGGDERDHQEAQRPKLARHRRAEDQEP